MGAIVAAFALLFTLYTFITTRNDRLKDELLRYGRRQYYAKVLYVGAGVGQRYQHALQNLCRIGDEFFGPYLLSWRALDRYLIFALFYPGVFFALAYLFGGPAELAGAALFPSGLDWLYRIWRVLLLFAILSVIIFCARKIFNKRAGLKQWIALYVSKKWSCGWRSTFLDWLIVIAFFTVAGGFAGAGAATVAGAGSGPVAGALVGAAAGILTAVLLGTASSIIGVHSPEDIVASLVVVGDKHVPSGAVALLTFALSIGVAAPAFGLRHEWVWAYMLFFVALPIANAFADIISWAVTRWFVREAARRGFTFRVFMEAIFDLLIAASCLIFLVTIMPNVIEAFNYFFPSAMVDWVSLAKTARTDPFGEGFLITGMLFTTLVPTAVHLFYGIGGALVAPLAGQEQIAARLAKWPESKGFDDPTFEAQVVKAIRVRQWKKCAWVFVAAAILMIGWLLFSFAAPNFADFLFEVAMCSTWWQGSSCAPMWSSLKLW